MNWRTPITLVVLLGLLLGAAYYGWQTVTSSSSADEDGGTTTHRKICKDKEHFRAGQRVHSGSVRVNVYNAGVITGLAASTLTNLRDRGFRPGTAENAPEGFAARNVTIVTRTRDLPQVQLVARQFQGIVRYVKDDLDHGVDVLVGNSFVGIDPTAKRTLLVKKAVTTCVAPARSSD